MEVTGIAHCLFEQSGIFKNEFEKLGIKAVDYDIENKFNNTDVIIDLFREIERGYKDEKSIFDDMTKNDVVLAFFPCTYFATAQMLIYSLESKVLTSLTPEERIQKVIERIETRTHYHVLLYQLLGIAIKRGLRLIIENPATTPNYLITGMNFIPPTFIDYDRSIRGDFFKKPTAYWFVNCERTNGLTIQQNRETKTIRNQHKGERAGYCSIDRSMISETYAKNFICDFILGRIQENSQYNIF